jgi:sporulation protein YlmC with PRC-barrel domain
LNTKKQKYWAAAFSVGFVVLIALQLGLTRNWLTNFSIPAAMVGLIMSVVRFMKYSGFLYLTTKELDEILEYKSSPDSVVSPSTDFMVKEPLALEQSKLQNFIEDAKIIVVTGKSGTGKSTFVKEHLKGVVVDPFDKVRKIGDKIIFGSKPDWQVSQVWGVEGLEDWEESSLQRAIVDVQAELTGSRKLVLVAFSSEEIERSGIVLKSEPCFVRFVGLGKATLEYLGETISMSLPNLGKDSSKSFSM